MEPPSLPWLHGFATPVATRRYCTRTLPTSADQFFSRRGFASSFLHPPAGLASFGAAFAYEAKAPFLWVEHKTQNVMEPPMLPWLHGFTTPVWRHLVQQSLMKQKHHPYGSTIKRTKCYGATDASMAPWVHNPGLASFGTAIAYEAKQHP